MPFPPSAACRFFDLPPVNLQNLPLHLTKNSFASAPTHLCGIAFTLRKASFPQGFCMALRSWKGGISPPGQVNKPPESGKKAACTGNFGKPSQCFHGAVCFTIPSKNSIMKQVPVGVRCLTNKKTAQRVRLDCAEVHLVCPLAAKTNGFRCALQRFDPRKREEAWRKQSQ